MFSSSKLRTISLLLAALLVVLYLLSLVEDGFESSLGIKTFLGIKLTIPQGYRIPNGEVLAINRRVIANTVNLRVLVNNVSEGEVKQSIKYIELLATADWDHRATIEIPRLASGDWNQATMKVDDKMRVYDPDYYYIPWPDVMTWHPLQIDYFELKKVKNLKEWSGVRMTMKSDFLQVVTHPVFKDPVVMKIASFPNFMEQAAINRETSVYQQIDCLGISPRFLGHVTEHGRAIGFLIEYLNNTHPAGEIWDEATRRACNASLRKLHSVGIAHGDAHSYNCLIREDGTAALIDFELATEKVTQASLFSADFN